MTQIQKGRLTVADTGEFVPFMFNPTQVQESHSVPYPEEGVPGVSHPVSQYTGGGPQVYSLELWLDGDRGRSVRARGGRAVNRLNSSVNFNDISIQDEIDWYRSLTLPTKTRAFLVAEVAPPVVLYTLGTMYRSVPCLVTQVTVTVTWWRPQDMAPIRATVSLSLKRQVSESIQRDSVYRSL